MQHRGEDHPKTNGNRIYPCHSCSDLHLNRENGKTHDLGTNHDYDKTSNLGHISHTNQNVRKRIAHTTINQILWNRSRPNRRWAQHTMFSNHTSPLQNFQSCQSCVAQIVFLSLNDNPTSVRPLLDTVAIETTPKNWNRNNQPTLQPNQKQLIVKLSEPVRMRKSQNISPTTKMLRMIGVPSQKRQTNLNALHVPRT